MPLLKQYQEVVEIKCNPFWNQNLESAVQSKDKARVRLEKNPTTSNKARKLTNSSKRENSEKNM